MMLVDILVLILKRNYNPLNLKELKNNAQKLSLEFSKPLCFTEAMLL